MEFFIRIKDGQPFEHPIIGDNFCQAFPDVDTNNLPAEFAKFVRVEQPNLGPYEVYVSCTYEKVDDYYTDVHHVRQMTDVEKQNLQNTVKQYWAENPFGPNWVFDEEDCKYYPTGRPTDDKKYRWNVTTMSWAETT